MLVPSTANLRRCCLYPCVQLQISSREVSDRLLDIRVQLAMLANRQTRLDNPMLEARIKRIKLVLDESVGGGLGRQDDQGKQMAAAEAATAAAQEAA